MNTQEIIAADESIIQIRFLKESTDFEVFVNGIQIDNSETSPKKVVDNLKWPIYFCIAWYVLVLGFCYFVTWIFDMLKVRPSNLFFDPATIYLVTSSLIVVIILIVALIGLRTGNTLLYYVALIAVCGDTLFGVAYQIFVLNTSGVEFNLTFIFAFIVPLVFKSAAVRGFISNIKKYQQYVLQKSMEKKKTNAEIVDI